MTTVEEAPLALSDRAARQLANATKTTAQMSTITPRWLVHLLSWVPVEAGIYRLNKVRHPESVDVVCPGRDESELPQTYVDYEDDPREYFLSTVTTVVDVHTRVSDLYSSPYDQIKEQLRLTIETIKERQESELINNPDYGMLANVAGQPATVSLFGSQFITWRGIPLIPSDKVPLEEGKTKILLLRVGEERQGVVGLYQPGLTGEQSPGLSVRFMGISRNAIASYLISLYCSLAVLTDDALAVLDDVEVGKFHDYGYTYR